ncbi:MAG: hypothetical protein Q9182_004734 [Xanthomendoza sp. 2 TL-2023]
MPFPTPASTAPSHESPSNSFTLSAPTSETSNTDPSSSISQVLDSAPGTQGSSAGEHTKNQVEELAEKVFAAREGKEKEGGG